MVKLSGLWKQTDRNGKTILSGSLHPGAKLLILPNSFKKRDSDPDFVAFLAPIEKEPRAEPSVPSNTGDLF